MFSWSAQYHNPLICESRAFQEFLPGKVRRWITMRRVLLGVRAFVGSEGSTGSVPGVR